MERYSRAYRDPKSPLTPLTPLSSTAVFNFVLAGDSSLNDCVNKLRATPTNRAAFAAVHKPVGAKRYSEKFLKIRAVFEKPAQVRTPQQQQQKAKQVYLDVPRYGNYRPHPHGLQQPQKPVTPQRPQQVQQRQKFVNCCFRQASPITPKSLSPRIATLLKKVGMCKYRGLFQQEEIDLEVFRMLSSCDLEFMGICCAEDRRLIMGAVRFAYNKC